MFYESKKGLIGYSAVSENGTQLNLPFSKYKIKCNKQGITLTDKGKPVGFLFDKVYFNKFRLMGYSNNKVCEVNFELGFISPLYVARTGNVVVNEDNDVFYLSPTLTAVKTNFKIDNQFIENLQIKCFNNKIIAKNKQNKYGLLNFLAEQECPFVFDNPPTKIKEYLKVGNNSLNLITDLKKWIIVNQHNNLVLETDLPINFIGDSRLPVFCIYDNENNVSTVLEYNHVKHKFLELGTFKNKVINCYKSHDPMKINEMYFVTTNNENLIGLVNKENKVILENIYDSITLKSISSPSLPGFYFKKSTDVAQIESAGKFGVFSTKFNEIVLEPQFNDIDFINSRYFDNNYLFRFLAQTENGWGVINSNNEIELKFNNLHSKFEPKYTKRQTKNNEQIDVLTLKTKNDENVYINIEQENLVASKDEISEITRYETLKLKQVLNIDGNKLNSQNDVEFSKNFDRTQS